MSKAEVGVAILLGVVLGGAVLREIIRRVDAARPRPYEGFGGRVGKRQPVQKK